ncbi:MAG: hypothetical protein HQ559_13640 [Lentisphaerae bacterium]|nr:hypothetical protein [Lentisphaerota bacterium]
MSGDDVNVCGLWVQRAFQMQDKDRVEALKCLEEAERSVESYDEGVYVASAWLQFGMRDNALRAMPECPRPEEHDWQSITAHAECLMQVFGEDGRRICAEFLRKAETWATSADHLTRWIACVWHRVLGNEYLDDMRRCLGRAAELATTPRQWAHCADPWAGVFGDEGRLRARECLQEAGRVSESAWDWILCASCWPFLIGDEEDVKREVLECLRNGEAVAEHAASWLNLAEGYLDYAGNAVRDATRCMLLAEEFAVREYDWEDCASIWRERFEDKAAYARCMRQAQLCQAQGTDSVSP